MWGFGKNLIALASRLNKNVHSWVTNESTEYGKSTFEGKDKFHLEHAFNPI